MVTVSLNPNTTFFDEYDTDSIEVSYDIGYHFSNLWRGSLIPMDFVWN